MRAYYDLHFLSAATNINRWLFFTTKHSCSSSYSGVHPTLLEPFQTLFVVVVIPPRESRSQQRPSYHGRRSPPQVNHSSFV